MTGRTEREGLPLPGPSTSPNQGTPLQRSQGERPSLGGLTTVNWCRLVGKIHHDPDTQWAFKEENRKETYIQERWRENTPKMMQKAVYACRQWVIFLFINEWASLGKGGFADYNHSPLWQAFSLEGLFPHGSQGRAVFSTLPQGLSLTVVLIRPLNIPWLKVPALWMYKMFRKISSVHPECSYFSSLFSFTPAWQNLPLPLP